MRHHFLNITLAGIKNSHHSFQQVGEEINTLPECCDENTLQSHLATCFIIEKLLILQPSNSTLTYLFKRTRCNKNKTSGNIFKWYIFLSKLQKNKQNIILYVYLLKQEKCINYFCKQKMYMGRIHPSFWLLATTKKGERLQNVLELRFSDRVKSIWVHIDYEW